MSSRYGLVGFPLSHSFSKRYFSDKFLKESIEGVYELFPITSIDGIYGILNSYNDLKGLNVTIPYKQQIIPLLNSLSPEANQIGAVNTVKVVYHHNKPELIGYNTDAPAFEGELLKFMKNLPDKALVLGTGGASAAVVYVLKKLGIQFKFVSRKPRQPQAISYEEVTKDVIVGTRLIINCTPLGMAPNFSTFPGIPYEYLSSEHYLFDLVYNPEETEFLKKGKQQKAHVINGLGMLHSQAELSWNIWQDDK
ncbi:MAG TPA: shikimate dehydrogenase [Lentimicrobium sp.]|nr:shikimate dehydrogenase [Lentimicrobium sp.]